MLPCISAGNQTIKSLSLYLIGQDLCRNSVKGIGASQSFVAVSAEILKRGLIHENGILPARSDILQRIKDKKKVPSSFS